MDLTQVYFLHEIGEKANQEDYIWPEGPSATTKDKIFIVCDGVGGSENGEVASRIVAEYVGSAIQKMGNEALSGHSINIILSEARKSLVQYALSGGLSTDMGTTFALLVLYPEKAFVAWCGDSRVYHIRRGEILYRTTDHSLVNTLVKSGQITEEEALTHPKKNLILRAVKADESVTEADHHTINHIEEGDYFMLCSDGLLENITDKNLKFLIDENEKGNIDLIKAFQQFCYGKTRDNYSMFLMRVTKAAKPAVYKRKILLLIVFLVVLVAASGVMLAKYFSRKNGEKVTPALVQPVDSTLHRPVNGNGEQVGSRSPGDVRVEQTPASYTPPGLDDSALALNQRAGKKDTSVAIVDAKKTARKQSRTDTTQLKKSDSARKFKAIMPAPKIDSTSNQ